MIIQCPSWSELARFDAADIGLRQDQFVEGNVLRPAQDDPGLRICHRGSPRRAGREPLSRPPSPSQRPLAPLTLRLGGRGPASAPLSVSPDRRRLDAGAGRIKSSGPVARAVDTGRPRRSVFLFRGGSGRRAEAIRENGRLRARSGAAGRAGPLSAGKSGSVIVGER